MHFSTQQVIKNIVFLLFLGSHLVDVSRSLLDTLHQIS